MQSISVFYLFGYKHHLEKQIAPSSYWFYPAKFYLVFPVSMLMHPLNKQYFRFLWRKNVTFAISKHYKRFDVFTEAEANKAAGKYKNASIDFQIEFYKKEGLTPYSEAKLPIISGRWNF